MLSLKVEGQGHIDIQPDVVIAFEEIKEHALEARPNAKCGIFYDIGEGLNTTIVENNYEVLKGAVGEQGRIELNLLTGPTSRRITVPRGSVVYREELVYTDEQIKEAEFEFPKTVVKVNLSGQIITLTTKESRDEISLL